MWTSQGTLSRNVGRYGYGVHEGKAYKPNLQRTIGSSYVQWYMIQGRSGEGQHVRRAVNPIVVAADPRPQGGGCLGDAPVRNRLSAFSTICLAVRSDQQGNDVVDAASAQLISDVMSAAERGFGDISEGIAAALNDSRAQSLPTSEHDDDIRSKVQSSIIDLQRGLLERETEVRLLLLAALCGEHLLLLGPPGTAKSELSRRLSSLTGGKYFERLLTRFSVPEELFGPLSIQGLEHDEYNRKIEGYLPTAEVAFIDEIFKANSAILNALLTLLNERLFDNGSERIPVPLLCLVGASNELPESEELDALYDRFLIRKSVEQVSKAQLARLAKLAAGDLEESMQEDNVQKGNIGMSPQPQQQRDLEMKDFLSAASEAVKKVSIGDDVIDIITDLRNYLQDKAEPPVYVSDRRFMKAINMMQVAAYADNRTTVNESDCLLLEYVMGQRPDDARKVRMHILETLAADKGLQQCELVFLGLFGRACNALEGGMDAEITSINTDAQSLLEVLASRLEDVCMSLELDFPRLQQSVWLSESSKTSAIQYLTPYLEENKERMQGLIRETLILRTALEQKIQGGCLERLLPKRFKQYEKGIAGRV